MAQFSPSEVAIRRLSSILEKACYGIFAISAATLLLEIAFTRLFSAIFFYHFSFLVISTGLFGFGVSACTCPFYMRRRTGASTASFPVAAMCSLLFAVSRH